MSGDAVGISTQPLPLGRNTILPFPSHCPNDFLIMPPKSCASAGHLCLSLGIRDCGVVTASPCNFCERSLSRLKATPERSCAAWSKRWRLRVRICRRWSSMRQLCRLSSSVLLPSILLQQELAVCKVLEWFPGIFRVWVIFPLNKVLLTLFLQDSFNFKFLFFL